MEYEYSFKVNDIKPYIDYIEEEKYEKISMNNQTRDLYTNDSDIMARVTINNETEIFIDFKESDNSDKILKETKESKELKIDINELDSFYSILEILGYKLEKHLVRKRVVYKKRNVKFEIDEYSEPENMNVVAIEGLKEEVDKVYNNLKYIIN